MTACSIYFFHVEVVTCQLSVIISALSVSVSLYNSQERWNKCLIWVLSRPPFMFPVHALHTRISSCLDYTFWKLAWRGLILQSKLFMCIAMLTYFLEAVFAFCVWFVVGFFFLSPQANQHQTNVAPYKEIHLTVQAFPWGKSLSCLWKETFPVPYLIKSTAHCDAPGIFLRVLTSVSWKQNVRRVKAPRMYLDIRFNSPQGSHCMFFPCIFNLHLSKIKCRYPGSILTVNSVLQLDVRDCFLA